MSAGGGFPGRPGHPDVVGRSFGPQHQEKPINLGRARAWAWIDHLRHGGTTPWRDWTSADGTERSRFLPGAQQLELLRRLNLVGQPKQRLVERVVAASAPGRGRPDLELSLIHI